MRVTKLAIVGMLWGFGVGCSGSGAVVDGGLDHLVSDGFADILSDRSTTDTPAAGGDAATFDPACDLSKPFGSPSPIAGFSDTHNDISIFVSADGLAAYIASARSFGIGGIDIWEAGRGGVASPFGDAVLLAGVSNADNDWYPSISHDGLSLFISRGAPFSLIFFNRPSAAIAFNDGAMLTIGLVKGLDQNEGDAYRHWRSADERLLYFDSMRSGGMGGNDIYVADLAGTAASNVRNLASINTANDEGAPVLTADGLTLYFTSRRPGNLTPDYDDIWVARRARITDDFGAADNVRELNTDRGESAFWVSPGGCTLYFAHIGDGATRALYQANRGS